LAIVAPADCEAVHSGLLRQPADTYSSLALLAVGVWILARAAAREPGDRGELSAFGVAMLGAGVGSVLLHGPDPAWALWFHDLSALAVLLLVVALDVGLLLGWSLRIRLLVAAALLVPLALALGAVPTSTDHIAWALAPAAGLSVVAVIRRGLHPGPFAGDRPRTLLWLLTAVTLALAGGAYALGRSESAFCHPGSVVQWHAVWHILLAIFAGVFAELFFRPTAQS
jgi:hypothetical protein